MPWSHPAARMRELILAMRAIWASWYDGKKLDFRGEFYAHTLMTPMFVPADKQYGAPRVTVAGVNPLMTETAGEVADGLVAHGFTTARYLHEVTLPAIERGLQKAGRARDGFELCCPVFIVTGDDEQKFAASRDACRAQIAFYASTPSYRPVLELHGWGALQEELNALTRKGAWAEMSALVTDEILETVAVVVPDPDTLAERVRARCGGIVDRLAFTAAIGDAERLAEQIRRLRAA
jgi:probable F420-dependent oxidoreductase